MVHASYILTPHVLADPAGILKMLLVLCWPIYRGRARDCAKERAARKELTCTTRRGPTQYQMCPQGEFELHRP